MRFQIEIEESVLEEAWKELTDETRLLIDYAFGDFSAISRIGKMILRDYAERTGKLRGGDVQHHSQSK